VMKKSVAHLENYLEKVEGVTKGTVVIATVYGDVHDIGKNLVKTILANNGYTRSSTWANRSRLRRLSPKLSKSTPRPSVFLRCWSVPPSRCR
ncbi:MAG: hypothetical protein IMZ71_01705, partial [Chloroflexi bacterium]|nr:hypothetical protein [Chloroflexota bacterium]